MQCVYTVYCLFTTLLKALKIGTQETCISHTCIYKYIIKVIFQVFSSSNSIWENLSALKSLRCPIMTLNQHRNEFREQARSCLLLSAGLRPQGLHVGGKSPFQPSPPRRPTAGSREKPKRSQVFVDFYACFTARWGAVQGVWSTAEVDVMFRLRNGPKQRNQSWLIPSTSHSPALH